MTAAQKREAEKKAAAAAEKLKASGATADEAKADEVKADEVKIDEKDEHDEAMGKAGDEAAAQVSPSPSLPVSTSSATPAAPRYKLGVGKPRDGHPRYFTPPPFDVFAKR